MDLTGPLLRAEAEAYRMDEPLYPVECEQIEMLPDAFEAGTFGRRDAEWVVQWYYQRFLGAYPTENVGQLRSGPGRMTSERYAKPSKPPWRRPISAPPSTG